MSQISSIFGTDNDAEIIESLYLIANVRVLSMLITLANFEISEHGRARAHPRVSKYL